jgi:NAD+ kinase
VHKEREYDKDILRKVDFLVCCLKKIIDDCKVIINDSHQNRRSRQQEEDGGQCEHQEDDPIIDFVITIGGDGTVLETVWMFQQVVPPVMSFNVGTLGFLTNFQFCEDALEMESLISQVVSPPGKGPLILLRMRLTCNFIQSSSNRNKESLNVLNEVTVERSLAGQLTVLDVIVDGRQLTTAAVDGLIIATPTGSTAYSMSAGGSVVHPDVPCILITPVSPHSLSFRPIILPESTVIEIRVSQKSRSSAWVCLDGGRARRELGIGESIYVTASAFPVPTVCKTSQSSDWFDSLGSCFKWALH